MMIKRNSDSVPREQFHDEAEILRLPGNVSPYHKYLSLLEEEHDRVNPYSLANESHLRSIDCRHRP